MAFDLNLTPLDTWGACTDSSNADELAIRLSDLGLTSRRGYIPDGGDSSVGMLACNFSGSTSYADGWKGCGEYASSNYEASSGSWTYESVDLDLP